MVLRTTSPGPAADVKEDRMFLRLSTIMTACLTLFAATPAFADCGNRDFGRRPGNAVVIGLTADQHLIVFRECQPRRARDLGPVTGLSGADTSIIGIDYRVQDGRLYGVGNQGGVYVIDAETANATAVSQLTVALDGSSFGVDFNPAADRLRIISDKGQNLRHNVNPGGTTLVDTVLGYTAGTAATGLTAAAYVNNDLDPNTGTTLFDIDTSLDQVSIQSPPNAGSLVAAGRLTVDADSRAGFDILTTLDDGVAVDNQGFAVLTVGGGSGFYSVNLLTGRASLIGQFSRAVIDIALPFQR
jgi:Domain of unknown function (DUF4394)